MYSNSSLHIGRVALKTIRLYLAAIRFTYVDYILLVIVFKNALLRHILDRATSLNPSLKEFTASSGLVFSTLYIQKILKLRLNLYSIPAAQYIGYSFYRGVA